MAILKTLHFFVSNSHNIHFVFSPIYIRLAQLGKTMHDQYGPEICHT